MRYRLILPLLVLPLLALPVVAAAPQRGFNLSVPTPGSSLPVPPVPPASPPSGGPQPAPVPNRDIEQPSDGSASTAPSLSPGLFSRSETYRGDGFSKGSTVQSDLDKRTKPAAGFNLKMPFTPN